MRLNAPGAIVGAWLSVVGVGVPGSAVALADADILPPGEALTRELAAGEAHVFEFALEADQLLDAVVEQQGVDVAMTLLEPAGTAALQIDSQENPKRFERVLWIARASGLHSLRVQASPGRPGGGYQILLSLPRAATLGDVGHVSAQREYERGCRLRKEGTPRSHAEARPWLENAIAGFRRAEDPRGEAEAKEHLTEIELAAGRTAEALAIAQDSLAIQRQLHDRAAEATGLQRIGRVYRALGRSTEAMACVLDAVRLARESANDWAEALYLNTAGIFYRRNGDTERAIEAFDVALAKSRASGNRNAEAAAVGNRGIAYSDLGEYRKTLEDYREALSLYEAAGDHWSAALTYNNMGNVHKRLGEYERARELYVHFLTLAHEREPGGVGEARALNSLSSLFIKMGDYSEALSYARRSLEMKVKGGDLRGQATVMKNIGESLHAMGQSEEGLKSLREALRIIRDVGDRHYEAQTRLEIARVERDRGNLGEALREAEAAVSLTEELRAAVTNPDLRASFVAAEQDNYAVYIEVLMRLHEQEAAAGHDAAALQASERARARVLLDTLIEARADVRQGVDPALLDRERALQKQLSEASELLSRVLVRRETSEAVANARQELAARSEEYRQVQSRIRQESPRYAALTQPVPSTVEEIRRELLDEETVLLEFYLGEERSFLWAVTRTELVSQALPKSAQIGRASCRERV